MRVAPKVEEVPLIVFLLLKLIIVEAIDLKLYIHINQPLPANILCVFYFDSEGKTLKKKKSRNVWNFSLFSKFRKSEIAVLQLS